MTGKSKRAAAPRTAANKTYAQTITARFAASDAPEGSPEWLAELATRIGNAASILLPRTTPKKGYTDLKITWRARALLAARDALMGQAFDDGYRGAWATTWVYRKPAKKRAA